MSGTRSLRWNGREWQSAPLPIGAYRLTGTDEEPWIVGGFPNDLTDQAIPVARWTGSAWQYVPLPELKLPPGAGPVPGEEGRHLVNAVVRTGPEEFWVIGELEWQIPDHEYDEDLTENRSLLLRHRSGTWTCFWGPEGGPGTTVDPEGNAIPDGKGGLWATAYFGEPDPGTLWHMSGGRWTLKVLSAPDGCSADVTVLVTRGGTTYALGAIQHEKERWMRAALWQLSP